MRTDITFLIDSTRLPRPTQWNPGTFNDPIVIGHFPMKVVHDMGSPEDVPANTVVGVRRGDQVNVYTMDASLLPVTRIAPVKINAHEWAPQGGASVILTAGYLDGAATKPIDQPRFDDSFPEVPKLNYKGKESDWTNVTPADHMYWTDGAECGQDVQGSSAELYGPFMTFNAQRHRGTLTYGIEFAVASVNQDTGNTDVVYYYFDPQIRIH
ncbi:MAG: hypothetical protein AAF799_24035 [Myxococcota bacterium]